MSESYSFGNNEQNTVLETDKNENLNKIKTSNSSPDKLDIIRNDTKRKYRTLKDTAPFFKDVKNRDLENFNEGCIKVNTLAEFKILLEEAGYPYSKTQEILNYVNDYGQEAEKNGLKIDYFSLVVRREILEDGTVNVATNPVVTVSWPKNQNVDESVLNRLDSINSDSYKVDDSIKGEPSEFIRELVKRNKKGEVISNTLEGYRRNLKDFGFSKEQADEMVHKEELNSLNANKLGLKISGYGIRYDVDDNDISRSVYLNPFTSFENLNS